MALWRSADTAGPYEQAKSAARAAGIPMSVEEARPQPPINPGDNAAPLLKPVLNKLELERKSSARLQELMEAGNYELALKECEELFALLEGAKPGLAKTRLDFDRDYSRGVDVKFPELASMKALTQITVHRARIAKAQNDHAKAIEYLKLGHKLESLHRDEYTIIGFLVTHSLHRITNRGYRQVAVASEGQVEQLEALLASFDPPEQPSIERAIKTDSLLAQSTIEREFQIGRGGTFNQIRTGQRGLTLLLQETVKDVESLRRSGNDVISATEEMDARSEKVEASLIPDPGIVLFTIIRPLFGGLGLAQVQSQADQVVTRAYIQILIHKAKTQRWPRNLQEVGITEADPFNGKPLNYRTDVSGMRIWSIGADRDDDDGQFLDEIKARNRPSPTSLEEKGDIVAIYPPPK
ncbi:MAG: hypothetical protein LCH41_05050 [Armatimonadetes bacterium]|nr:hypothetical protein [Armatimonadota bacterium]